MTEPNDSSIDWSLTTWKGSRRRQHEEWRALPFAEKLSQIEEMNEFAVELSGKSLAELNEQSHRVARSTVMREEPPGEDPIAAPESRHSAIRDPKSETTT